MDIAVHAPSGPARDVERWGPAPTRDARPRARSTPRGGLTATAPAGRAATRRLRVRWRRVAVLALLVLAVAAVVVAGRGPAGAARSRDAGVVVVVGEGETLWDVLSPHVPAGVDRADFVANVVAANDLDPLRLRPGTAVRLR